MPRGLPPALKAGLRPARVSGALRRSPRSPRPRRPPAARSAAVGPSGSPAWATRCHGRSSGVPGARPEPRSIRRRSAPTTASCGDERDPEARRRRPARSHRSTRASSSVARCRARRAAASVGLPRPGALLPQQPGHRSERLDGAGRRSPQADHGPRPTTTSRVRCRGEDAPAGTVAGGRPATTRSAPWSASDSHTEIRFPTLSEMSTAGCERRNSVSSGSRSAFRGGRHREQPYRCRTQAPPGSAPVRTAASSRPRLRRAPSAKARPAGVMRSPRPWRATTATPSSFSSDRIAPDDRGLRDDQALCRCPDRARSRPPRASAELGEASWHHLFISVTYVIQRPDSSWTSSRFRLQTRSMKQRTTANAGLGAIRGGVLGSVGGRRPALQADGLLEVPTTSPRTRTSSRLPHHAAGRGGPRGGGRGRRR